MNQRCVLVNIFVRFLERYFAWLIVSPQQLTYSDDRVYSEEAFKWILCTVRFNSMSKGRVDLFLTGLLQQ